MDTEDFRKAALAAARDAIDRAKQHGGQLNVGELVGSILTKFPTTGLDHANVESEIARMALVQGVKIIEFRPAD